MPKKKTPTAAKPAKRSSKKPSKPARRGQSIRDVVRGLQEALPEGWSVQVVPRPKAKKKKR